MMVRLGVVLAVYVCLGAGASVEHGASAGRQTLAFGVDGISFHAVSVGGSRFVQPALRGVEGYQGVRYRPGAPELPAVRIWVEGTRIEVEALSSWEQGSAGRAPWKPSLEPVAKVAGARVSVALSSADYRSPELVPPHWFEIERVGTRRGTPVWLVSVYPLRHRAASGDYEWLPRFRVSWAPASAEPVPARGERIVYVAGERFAASPALKRYVSIRRAQGWLATIWVFGRDVKSPAEIRAGLKRLLADSSYRLAGAVIVGDHADVPGAPAVALLSSQVTDHYYRCIDTDDYSADIGTPDIEVGRLAVSTEAELSAVVDKIERYETGVFQDERWLERFSFIASDDASFWQIAEGSFDYLVKLTAPLGFVGTFPRNPNPGGDLLYAITHKVTDAQVVERMREGRSFISYGGHGGVGYWVAPRVEKADVMSLSHDSALPFVVSNACVTGQFTGDSFGETWQKHPQGAIAFWGSMGNTYWDEDDILQRRMYDAMFQRGQRRISDFTAGGLAEVWKHYGGLGKSKYYWETYVTFGDPFTRLRTRTPRVLRVEVPAAVGRAASLAVRVADTAGKAVSGGRVSLTSRTQEVSLVATTGADGIAKLEAPSALPSGEYDLSAVGDDLRWWRGVVVVR